jgi:uncharacterized protein (TIGR03083 family)
MADIWPAVHAERRALADDLRQVSDDRWDTPSLCEGWSVRDVLAHMTGTAKITPLLFFPKLITSGFSLGRLQEKAIVEERGASPKETLANFEAVIDSTKAPPGPKDTWLGETIVHGEDIRRPLGISYDYPTDETIRVADFYKGSNLVMGSKKRVAGLRLRATDADWTHGDGPEVAGPMVSLLMVMAGRKAHLDDLTGEGVATLRQR